MYTVNQSIWLATALLSAEVYSNNPDADSEDYYFEQATIIKRAKLLSDGAAETSRTSWYCCADHEKSNNNYLRGDLPSHKSLRRLSRMDEFAEKTYPEDLDMTDVLQMNDLEITIEELFNFVKYQYPVAFENKTMNCDFEKVFDFINTYKGKKYIKPEKTSPDQYDYMTVFHDQGVSARQIVLDYANVVAAQFTDMEVQGCSNWINAGQVCPGYFWVEIKRKDCKEFVHSISLAFRHGLESDEDGDDVITFRVEVRDNNCTEEDYARHNTLVEVPVPVESGIFYQKTDHDGKFVSLGLDQERAKAEIKSGEIKKLKVVKNINPPYTEARSTEIVQEGVETVKMLIPFYEHIVNQMTYLPDLSIIPPEKNAYDKNMILYGPPGTGKTYNTAIYAVAIATGRSLDDLENEPYSQVMDAFIRLKKENRIAFTTFHQSYGYEEFIEGIKPVVDEEEAELGYTIEPGIFKKFCEYARTPADVEVDPNTQIWIVRLDTDKAHVNKDQCFKYGEIRYDHLEERETEDEVWFQERFVDGMNIGDYVVSYAGNSVFIDGIGLITGEAVFDSGRETYRWNRKVKWLVKEKKINVKEINSNRYLPNFSISKMSHMKVSDLLTLVPTDHKCEKKPYIFIIDEINRGNISKIFGELITLIEDTKREGMEEQTSAILPYSGESFSVPENVYILGTMNTADRSIALMDTALRRRFQFVEKMPDSKVLRTIGADKVEDLDVAAMLDKINERITFLYDREHTIGHAFFTKLAKTPTIECLKSIFMKSVIPLLQEYFYEDYQKIQLVLGDNGKSDPAYKFICDEEVKVKAIFKGNAEDLVDLPEKKYSINEKAFDRIESYKEIL